MRREQKHKSEIMRLASSHQGTGVWVKDLEEEHSSWKLSSLIAWFESHAYVVDDCHQKLRRLQLDEPDTQFEFQDGVTDKWVFVKTPTWRTDIEYRIKHKWESDLGKGNTVLCWVSDSAKNTKVIATYIVSYTSEDFYTAYNKVYWRYASPVDPAELTASIG